MNGKNYISFPLSVNKERHKIDPKITLSCYGLVPRKMLLLKRGLEMDAFHYLKKWFNDLAYECLQIFSPRIF